MLLQAHVASNIASAEQLIAEQGPADNVIDADEQHRASEFCRCDGCHARAARITAIQDGALAEPPHGLS
jgi:hypothetical protein